MAFLPFASLMGMQTAVRNMQTVTRMTARGGTPVHENVEPPKPKRQKRGCKAVGVTLKEGS